jgi:protein-tyrosine phosphatase
MGFIDLHSHVLPALDDGVKGLQESLEVLGLLGTMGFEIVCATPHQKLGSFVPSREAIDGAYSAVKDALLARGVPLQLYLGAENYWDELFLERSLKRTQPAYTGGRAFLVEIDPRMPPPRFEERLFQMRIAGLLPVLAHPERYGALCHTEGRIESLRGSAALVVDLGALAGAHGPDECRSAQRLVKEGLAHAVATDAHSAADVRAAGDGMTFIKKKLGEPALKRLLEDNPRQILLGELPD